MFMFLYEKLHRGEDNHVYQVIMREVFLIFFTTIPISMSIMNLKGEQIRIFSRGVEGRHPLHVSLCLFLIE